MALNWLNLDPALQDGFPPTYGEYGGPGYSGGETIEPGETPDFTVPAQDPLDELFRAHDLVYYDPEATADDRAEADIALIEGILALPEDAVTGAGDVYAGVAVLALLYQVSVVNGRPDLLAELDVPAVVNQAGDLIAEGSAALAPEEVAEIIPWLETVAENVSSEHLPEAEQIAAKVEELVASLDIAQLPDLDDVLTDEAFDFAERIAEQHQDEAVEVVLDLSSAAEDILSHEAVAPHVVDTPLADIPTDLRALAGKIAAFGQHDFFT